MRFLIYVDGTPLSEQAVRFGAGLAAPAGAAVTLLGAAGATGSATALQPALNRAQTFLPRPAEVKIRQGRGARAMLAEAAQGSYDLIVAGSRGRRGWERLAFGSVAARLARYSPVPVLIVKGAPRPGVRRVLACTGGNVPGERVARWGGQIAGWMKAELAVLHVMSQLALTPTTSVDPLQDTAEEAIADQTPEGRHLARELELAQASGQPRTLRPKLRHGLVVEEVTAEADQGNYDLVVIGGHQAPEAAAGWGPLRQYLLEDVADQIIMALQRPVLVVKGA